MVKVASLTLVLILVWILLLLVWKVLIFRYKIIPELTIRPPGPPEAQSAIAQTSQLESTAKVEDLELEKSDVAQQLEVTVARAKTKQTQLTGLPEKYNNNDVSLVLWNKLTSLLAGNSSQRFCSHQCLHYFLWVNTGGSPQPLVLFVFCLLWASVISRRQGKQIRNNNRSYWLTGEIFTTEIGQSVVETICRKSF